MAFDYDKMRGNPPMDYRMVREIQRSPQMLTEQGGGAFLEDWGGVGLYRTLSRLPARERLVYAAVLEGSTSVDGIATVTDLSLKDVEAAIADLRKKGMVSVDEGLVGEK